MMHLTLPPPALPAFLLQVFPDSRPPSLPLSPQSWLPSLFPFNLPFPCRGGRPLDRRDHQALPLPLLGPPSPEPQADPRVGLCLHGGHCGHQAHHPQSDRAAGESAEIHPLSFPSPSPLLTLPNFQIRGMGMNSQELLKLVKNCPKGAETLVTRCLHSLTDKGTTLPGDL